MKLFKILLSVILVSTSLATFSTTVKAETIDYHAQAETRKSLPVETNSIENWPQGPAIGAEGAILMEVNTGTILYAKNIHEKLYPASTTKILTALIAAENSSMDEEVYYSNEAVTSINWREDSNMGIKPESVISMEQSLYGLMVQSANEAGNAIAEHISGSTEEFVNLMNERAKELGCENSHFVTTNGLFDEEHYTTPYDLALIACEYFKNDTLCKIANTSTYTIPPSSTQPDELILHTKNKLVLGGTYGYDYLVGSKTGYTSEARQTLVSCAQKDGMKLVCVIMKEETPNQFTDTIELFDYGFNNFKAVNVSSVDDRYQVGNNTFFKTNTDIFGSSEPILSIDEDDYIILPADADYADTESSMTYDTENADEAALVHYTYNGTDVGTASIRLSSNSSAFAFEEETAAPAENASENAEAPAVAETESGEMKDITTEAPADADAESTSEESVIFVNVKNVVLAILGIAVLLIILLFVRSAITDYTKAKHRKEIMKRRRSRRDDEINFDRYDDGPEL